MLWKKNRKRAEKKKKVLNEIDQKRLHRTLNAATTTTTTTTTATSQLQLNKLGSYHLFIEVLCGKAECNIGLFGKKEKRLGHFQAQFFAPPVAVHHNQMTEWSISLNLSMHGHAKTLTNTCTRSCTFTRSHSNAYTRIHTHTFKCIHTHSHAHMLAFADIHKLNT